MRRGYSILIIGLFFVSSCVEDDVFQEFELCENDYFYYSGGSKIFFKHSLNEVFIEFEKNEVTKRAAENIIKKYPFLTIDSPFGNNHEKIRTRINVKCDCNDFNKYLLELNKDSEIISATPVFYTSANHPDYDIVLLSSVLTRHVDSLISESDFINYAKTLNLEHVSSSHLYSHVFKVKEVRTGFEALEIANEIYESEKVVYSHPNFILKIVPSDF